MQASDSGTEGQRSPWIGAWSDPVAGVNSFSQLMTLSDLRDDGDYKLITADYKTKRLKVFMGTNVLHTAALQNIPTALTTFYDSAVKPMVPIIAVAIDSSIYYFKDFAPFMRFDLPNVTFSSEEQQIWAQMLNIAAEDEQSFIDATEKLFAIRERGEAVSALTSELISFEDITQQREYFNLKRHSALIHKNFIPCLCKINKNLEDEKSV